MDEPRSHPVDLGSAIFALHDPERGHEVAFHRYYERDHMYAAAIMAPWTIAGQRFIATHDLKALRYPSSGPFGPAVAGSFLTAYWIQDGHLADQQRWVAEQMVELNAAGRTFSERTVQTATAYDLVGTWERDLDGVPPWLALDHRYPGLVWLVVERTPSTPVEELITSLIDDVFPAEFGSGAAPVAMAVLFTPRPKEPWWPPAAPDVPGVGERLMVALFLEEDPRTVWDTCFRGLGASIERAGCGRALLVAPFIPTVPGTDRHLDELWQPAPAVHAPRTLDNHHNQDSQDSHANQDSHQAQQTQQ